MSETAPGLAFFVLGAAEGGWATRGETPIEARDLGLAAASGGRLGGAQLRNTGRTDYALDWHCHDNDLHFVYVLAGSFVLEVEGSDPATLRVGSAAALPALLRHKEYAFSADFAGLMFTAPAAFDTIQGRDDAALPERARTLDPDRHARLSHDAPEEYAEAVRHLRHRDLGGRAVTDGRIDLRVARSDGSGEGNGRHYSTAAQWFIVLDGAATMELEGRPGRRLGRFDSMGLPAGPGATRELSDLTAEFAVLNLCVPGSYESVPVEQVAAERYFER